MNWFKRVARGLRAAEKASELAQDLQTHEERVKGLHQHVVDLGAAVDAQERSNAQMLTEWATTLDKISRWASRQSARERKDTHAKLDTLAAGPSENGQPETQATLTKPELRALAARMRMGPHVTSHEGS